MRFPTSQQITARNVARVSTVLAAVMLSITAVSTLGAGAAPSSGSAVITDPSSHQPLTSGGSSTSFTLALPSGAACTGDSASGGYRVQSYMVPSNVDPSTLSFGASGPTPSATGANFREPLFDTTSNAYVNAQTANATTSGGPGPIINIPSFNFEVFSPGDIPAGTYNLGIACTLNGSVDKFFNAQATFSVDNTDSPAHIHWVVGTTTTTTTSTTSTSTTSTTTPTSTTSSTSTTSTTAPTTTTSTTAPTSTTSSTSTTSTTAPTTTTSTSTTSTTAPTSTTSSTTSTTSPTSTTSSSTSTTAPTSTTSSSTSTTLVGSTSTSTTTPGSGTASATGPGGTPLTSGQTLSGGEQITLTGGGFVAGEVVTVAAHSTTITLTSVTANSSGTTVATVFIPNGLAAGSHTITMTGAQQVDTFAFQIAAAPASTPLPATGSNSTMLVFWGVLLIVSGSIAVRLGRVREDGGS